jgi:hypothetical protein
MSPALGCHTCVTGELCATGEVCGALSSVVTNNFFLKKKKKKKKKTPWQPAPLCMVRGNDKRHKTSILQEQRVPTNKQATTTRGHEPHSLAGHEWSHAARAGQWGKQGHGSL